MGVNTFLHDKNYMIAFNFLIVNKYVNVRWFWIKFRNFLLWNKIFRCVMLFNNLMMMYSFTCSIYLCMGDWLFFLFYLSFKCKEIEINVLWHHH